MHFKPLINSYFLKLYFFVILIGSFGIALFSFQAWQEYKFDVESSLLREARATTNVLDGLFIDADKVLELTRAELMPKGRPDPPPALEVYKAFNRSKNFFDSYFTDSPFGLMLYLDSDGIVRATSQEYPTKPVDLSDRLYFDSLKVNPTKKFSLGVLVFARTTGLATYHLALPIINGEGKFLGVLAQQIVAKEAATKLRDTLDSKNAEISVLVSGQKIMFRYPNTQVIESDEMNRLAYLEREAIFDQKSNEGVHFVQASEPSYAFENSYVAFSQSKSFGFRSYALISQSKVISDFFRSISVMLTFFALAFIGISYFFYYLYLSSNALDEATVDSLTDQLTMIPNRRALDLECQKLWNDAIRQQSEISCLFIDIDFFKKFNDAYGHEHGDLVLKKVSQSIKGCINRPLDFLCRWGGEEFVLILPNTDQTGALKVAECVLAQVRDILFPFCHSPMPHVTVSIGLSTLRPQQSMYASDLIDLADKAMYKSKQTGRNKCSIAQ